jgi:hypothetical protein
VSNLHGGGREAKLSCGNKASRPFLSIMLPPGRLFGNSRDIPEAYKLQALKTEYFMPKATQLRSYQEQQRLQQREEAKKPFNATGTCADD